LFDNLEQCACKEAAHDCGQDNENRCRIDQQSETHENKEAAHNIQQMQEDAQDGGSPRDGSQE
jgi:hypothetical protein